MTSRERGSLRVYSFDSQVLQGNALHDPTERDLHVYLPPGYDELEDGHMSINYRYDTSVPALVKALRS